MGWCEDGLAVHLLCPWEKHLQVLPLPLNG